VGPQNAEKERSQAWTRLATLALPLVSVLIAVLVFELGLRLAGHRAIYDIYSKPTIFWQHDPLLGWSHEPGARAEYVGPRPWPIEFRTPVEINSLGLRGPEIRDTGAAGKRALFLGDSVVAAFEVPYHQTFVALLEADLAERLRVPVQTINAGVRGYGTDQSYLYYRERGRALRPDVVVFFHSGNDPVDNTTLHEMRRPFGKPAIAIQPDGALDLVGHPTPHYPACSEVLLSSEFEAKRVDRATSRVWCHVQMVLFDRSALFSYLTLKLRWDSSLLGRLYQLGNPHAQHNLDTDPSLNGFGGRLSMQILLALAEEARRDGAAFVLVGFPHDLEKLDADRLRSSGIVIVGLTEIASTPKEQWRWKMDGHFNSEGHRLMARALIDPVEAALRGRDGSGQS